MFSPKKVTPAMALEPDYYLPTFGGDIVVALVGCGSDASVR